MTQERREPSGLERLLSIFAEVKAGEGGTAVLLTLNVFLLLSSYYFIKPVREALILVMESGAEYKAYASAGIATLLLVAVPVYAGFANRLPRNRLIISVTLFFASNLVAFYFLGNIEAVQVWLGIPFYLWVGIFNMMVVAQFWAFANDIYNEEQGKRLFAIVGIGASSGATAGAKIAGWLIPVLGVYTMLLVTAAVLCLCAFLFQVVHLRELKRAADEEASTPDANPAPESKSDGKGGSFGLVFSTPYLFYIALFSLVFTWVNTNGEYILSRVVSETASEMVAAGELDPAKKGAFIGGFYGDFFFWVNLLGVVLQAFLVSRMVKWGGIALAFFALPVLSALGNTAVLLAPMLLVVRVSKTFENATDYSINNTVRNMLWLPTTAEMKYKAKQAVDTFFVRMGDVASAGLVFVLAAELELGVGAFAAANLALVVVWIILSLRILSLRKAMLAEQGMSE